jgi:hypothetical protein
LVGGSLTNVHQSAQVKDMILAESQWFTPNDSSVGEALTNVYSDYDKYVELAKRQAHYAKTNFTFDKMVEKLDNILENKVPKQVELKLPSLPKLKKV